MPGAKADIAIFDMADPLIAPRIDPVRSLILGATGRVTRAVFVDGRLSMREGKVHGLDMAAARTRAQQQFDGLVAKYPDRTWGHPSLPEIFPQSYPRPAGGRRPSEQEPGLPWQGIASATVGAPCCQPAPDVAAHEGNAQW